MSAGKSKCSITLDADYFQQADDFHLENRYKTRSRAAKNTYGKGRHSKRGEGGRAPEMKVRNSLILLLTAAIWGVAFVAQSVAMDSIGPFTFLCARSVIGGLVLLPVIALKRHTGPDYIPATREEHRAARRTLLFAGVCCGAALCFASLLQQFGILYTSVGKSGFITACYILLVPILGIPLGRRCGRLVWCGVCIALAGLYLLCVKDGLSLNVGDLLTMGCALLFSVQILLVDYFAPLTDNVALSCIQFFVGAIISGTGMMIFESPSWKALLDAWIPVLYAGALSSGVAYTLQIIGQKGMNPTIASLIMSLESVISVIAGWLILGQTLSFREILGCVCMFTAIVLAQLPDTRNEHNI